MNDLIVRFRRHYLPFSALILAAIIVFLFIFIKRDAITFTAQVTGYISIVLLAVSLVLGTLNLLRKNRNPVSTYFRRDLSVTGGVLAIIHSVTGLFVHLRGRMWMYFLDKTEKGYSVPLDSFRIANYTGLISAILILLLLITSNDLFIRRLGPSRWKNFQRLSYLMFLLAMVHSFLYRIPKEHHNLIYTFYIPLVSVVLVFQIIGIYMTLRQNK